MDEKKLSQEELSKLAHYAGQRLGMTPQQLANAVNTEGLSGLSRHLSERDAAQLNRLLSDPAKAEKLMAMPEVQQLLKQLLNGG